MSNNLIRKGLAIGASVSLALAGLVGFAAPAQAAGTVYLVPAEGSTYTMPVDEEFVLQAYFDSAAKRGSESVKFKVTDASSKLDLDTGTGTVKSGFSANYSTTANAIRTGSSASAWDNTAALTANTSRTDLVVSGGSDLAPTKHYLGLIPTGTTAFSVTVQAWMDLDNDNVIDSDEQSSEVRTVNWVPATGLAATTTMGTLAVGDVTVESSFTTTPAVNGAQLAVDSLGTLGTGTFSATLTNARSSSTYDAASAALKWDEANQKFTVLHSFPSFTGPATVTAERVVTVSEHLTRTAGVNTGDTIRVTVTGVNTSLQVDRALVSGGWDEDWTTTYALPTATSSTATGQGASAATVRVIVGENSYSVIPYYSSTAISAASATVAATATAASASSAASADANQYGRTSSGDTTVYVRSTASGATATYTVKNSTDVVVSGIVVKATVGGTLPSGLKINGVSYASGGVVSATTNSSGVATFAVTNTGEFGTGDMTLTVVAQGVAATSKVITFDGTAAAYKLIDQGDALSFDTGGMNDRSAVTGGSHTYNLSLVDQWMQVAPATLATHVNVAVTGRTASTTNVALSAGRVSVSVADGGLSTGAAAVTFTAKKLTGSTYANLSPSVSASSSVYFYSQTDSITLTSVAADLTEKRVAEATVSVNGATSAAQPFAGDTGVNVIGTVNNSLTGALKAGAQITISGPADVLFAIDGDKVTSYGTLTFFDSDGSFNVEAYSNKVQKDTVITVSSGSTSKTVKITFTASTVLADINAVTVTAAKSIKAGRTTTVGVAVVDKFGNTVNVSQNVSVTSSGVGYLTSYPTALTTGAAQVTLVTGSGDFGSTVISVTAAGVDNSLTTTTDDKVATAAIWVGPVANAFAGVKNGRVKIEAYRAKGKTVNVFVGSTKVASYTPNKANFSKSVKVKSGTRNVRVVIVGPSNDFRGAITVK